MTTIEQSIERSNNLFEACAKEIDSRDMDIWLGTRDETDEKIRVYIESDGLKYKSKINTNFCRFYEDVRYSVELIVSNNHNFLVDLSREDLGVISSAYNMSGHNTYKALQIIDGLDHSLISRLQSAGRNAMMPIHRQRLINELVASCKPVSKLSA
ncbi:hypothetical protein [Pleomorphomonas carboxyditropha]|uniref:hypothetical protein n=1 Tax=Pleomorphomonas carboxyditropha TaxID=2023338 RepID=UPI00105574B9|nr:hypothetical protein [Pleomorphomonas carboxyditropha]